MTGIINFAQGEFVMLGGHDLVHNPGLDGPPYGACTPADDHHCCSDRRVLYLLAIRPARKASVVSLIIITIGASIFIRGVAGQIWTKDYVRLPYFSGDAIDIFLGAYIQPQALWIIGTTVRR